MYNSNDTKLFRQYFGIELSEYWETPAFLGLDSVKLDEYLNPPDGVSTYEYIRQTVSPEAVNFVKELLGRSIPDRFSEHWHTREQLIKCQQCKQSHREQTIHEPVIWCRRYGKIARDCYQDCNK